MTMGPPMRLMQGLTRDRSVSSKPLAPGTRRRVLQFALPYRRQILLFLVVVILEAVASAAPPLVFRSIIDTGIAPTKSHGDKTVILVLSGLVAVIALVNAVLSMFDRYWSSRIGEGLIHDLRRAVYDHVQRQPLAFFSRTQTGALVSRLDNDVIGAQQAFTGTLSTVVSNVLTVVLTLGAMFLLSWQITLASLVFAPLFFVPARLLGPRMREITREGYQLNATMSTQMTERFNVAGALLVKLFGRPKDESEAFGAQVARVRDIGILRAMYGRVFLVALTLIASLSLALTYALGGSLAADRELGVGTIVALTAYLGRLYGPLTALSNVKVDVLTALVSFERVFEVLDLPPMVADAPEALDLPADAPGSLHLEHVDFSYPAASEVSLASLESVATLDTTPSHPVLHDVSFAVEPGQLVALVGPSGAGKTTISQLVTRIYDVNSGTVKVGGVDVKSVTQQSLRQAVGVVSQDAHLFHDTLRNNLQFAKPDATDDQIWAALEGAQIARLVRAMPDGLETVVGERGYRLSGGEKQRIAIARVLLKAPRIVVLDEATAHLDSESEAAVQAALSLALVGRTALVIAHRLSTVRSADQVLVLQEGRVVQRGTHDSLLAEGGLYSDLWVAQFGAERV